MEGEMEIKLKGRNTKKVEDFCKNTEPAPV